MCLVVVHVRADVATIVGTEFACAFCGGCCGFVAVVVVAVVDIRTFAVALLLLLLKVCMCVHICTVTYVCINTHEEDEHVVSVTAG